MTDLLEKYDLDRKVDAFIQQYERDLRRIFSDTENEVLDGLKRLRDHIEVKAMYAEFRWPFVYESHWLEEERHKNEEAQEILTWERFCDTTRNIRFVNPPLTPEEVNQQVLHRVIERGGVRVGPRRGVLFAQDFGLDVAVPVSYAIDLSDPYLEDFLEPLAPALDKDLVCVQNYFYKNLHRYRPMQEVLLGEILSRRGVRLQENSGTKPRLKLVR